MTVWTSTRRRLDTGPSPAQDAPAGGTGPRRLAAERAAEAAPPAAPDGAARPPARRPLGTRAEASEPSSPHRPLS
ncbi:hypothetical protein ACFWNK_35635 [Streptomyces sp. NPDC058417]|uniref:hypothetical protein n=1 Tax=unclassified Streptomyces TaxID=2593676 RepID=UPI00365A108A